MLRPPSQPDQPLYLVKDRQQGKTTTLVEWVKAGSPIDSLLGWSRIIIARNQSMKREMLHRYRLQGGQVIARQDIAHLGRGYSRALDLVTFAIDDAEDLILDSFSDALWGRIKIIAMTGDAALMEAEIIRATLDDPEAAQKRLDELDARLADQPDPTLLNAEGRVEEGGYRFGRPLGAIVTQREREEILIRGAVIEAERATKAPTKKTAAKKSSAKRS